MKRLTRKSNREYYETHIRSVDDNYTYEQFLQDRPYTLHHIYCVEYETKLGRLEDLEEELGCPLEVVFEALKNGIIINEEGYINSAYENEKFDKEEDSYYNSLNLYKSDNGYFFEDTNSPYGDLNCGIIGCNVALKDYQKTWWLKGEKYE